MNRRIIFFLFALSLLILVACSSSADATANKLLPTAIMDSPINTLLANPASPVETPQAKGSSSVQKPTTVAGSTVSGVIFLMQNGRKKPYAGAILYLAETIIDTNGNESFVAMDRINSPRTTADENGLFVFSNVPEGNYGLILDTIHNSYFLHYPESNEQVLVSVVDGSSIEIGELVFDN